MAYSYTPKIRVTPTGGNPYVIDLSVIRFATVVQPTYTPEHIEKVMIDRSRRFTRYGWYCDVHLEFTVAPGSTDDATIANTLNPVLEDDATMLEITLDGTRYEEAYLASWSRTNLDGKNVGAHYAMDFHLVNLLSAPNVVGPAPLRPAAPPVMTGW